MSKFKAGDVVRARRDYGRSLTEGQTYVVTSVNSGWVRVTTNEGGEDGWQDCANIFEKVEIIPAADPVHQPVAAGYPDDNPKTVLGLAKPSLAAVPPVALFKIGQAMSNGAAKYGRFNWRLHSVTASVYYDAALRHLMAWHDGEDVAIDSGVDHLAHAAACLCITMDAAAVGKLNDDRGPRGELSGFIAENTKTTA